MEKIQTKLTTPSESYNHFLNPLISGLHTNLYILQVSIKFFDKLCNFWLSSYLNNNRLKHRTLGVLKLFFERNNKVTDTFSNLGNVFRNAKWSDLQIQNIKKSLVNHKGYLLLVGVFIFLSVIFVLPYLYYLCYEVFWNMFRLTSSITQTIACIISIKCYVWVHYFSYGTTNGEQKIILQLTKSCNLQKPANISFGNVKKINQYDTNLIVSLCKLTNALLLFENNQTLNNLYTYPSMYLNNKVSYNSRLLTFDLFQPSFTTSSTSNAYIVTDSNFIPSILNSPRFMTNHTYNLSPIQFHIPTTHQHLLLFNLLFTQKTHDVLKQSRWSVKNSLISEDFIRQNNMFLNSKRLIGTTSHAKDMTDHNIWLSNFKTTRVIKGVASSQSLDTNEILKGFNTFEESRNFLFNRYLLFINNKTLLPTRLLSTQTFKTVRSSSYNTGSYHVIQEYSTRDLLSNNDVLFLNLTGVGIDTTLTIDGGTKHMHTDSKNNSVEFLRAGSATILSDLTSTKPSNTTTLPVNRNVSI